MACDLWQTRIEAYADAELPSTEMAAMDAHLRACPACAADAVARLQWKNMTRTAGARFAPDAAFRQRISQTGRPRRRSAFAPRWLPALGVAVALLLAGLFGIQQWIAVSQRGQALGELVDLHAAALASANPVDVTSSDRHTVKPWFSGKLPFSFNLPELSGTGFDLIGGRMAWFNQEPAAELIYAARKHRISVFILVDQPSLNRPFSPGTLNRFSFHVETWNTGGLRYFVIGDVSADEIRQLATLFKKSA